jgi:hypothetical protein
MNSRTKRNPRHVRPELPMANGARDALHTIANTNMATRNEGTKAQYAGRQKQFLQWVEAQKLDTG